jgi:5'-deoxynucleotidase YfbR-like HD superfamily hydrolase
MTQQELSLQEMLRASHVDRWQIVNVAVRQSIAEHMYRTYTICLAIVGVLEKDGWDDPIARAVIGGWSLLHDLPEVIVGDIPTPTKALMASRGNEKCIDSGISKSVDTLRFMAEVEAPVAAAIVKIADLAESIDFLHMNGLGSNANKICVSLRSELKTKFEFYKERHPNINWGEVESLLDSNIEGGL